MSDEACPVLSAFASRVAARKETSGAAGPDIAAAADVTLAGSKESPEIEDGRRWAAADWAIRTAIPAVAPNLAAAVEKLGELGPDTFEQARESCRVALEGERELGPDGEDPLAVVALADAAIAHAVYGYDDYRFAAADLAARMDSLESAIDLLGRMKAIKADAVAMDAAGDLSAEGTKTP